MLPSGGGGRKKDRNDNYSKLQRVYTVCMIWPHLLGWPVPGHSRKVPHIHPWWPGSHQADQPCVQDVVRKSQIRHSPAVDGPRSKHTVHVQYLSIKLAGKQSCVTSSNEEFIFRKMCHPQRPWCTGSQRDCHCLQPSLAHLWWISVAWSLESPAMRNAVGHHVTTNRFGNCVSCSCSQIFTMALNVTRAVPVLNSMLQFPSAVWQTPPCVNVVRKEEGKRQLWVSNFHYSRRVHKQHVVLCSEIGNRE